MVCRRLRSSVRRAPFQRNIANGSIGTHSVRSMRRTGISIGAPAKIPTTISVAVRGSICSFRSAPVSTSMKTHGSKAARSSATTSGRHPRRT